MRRSEVVVYLSNAVDESIKAERAITTDSPAATNKVLALTGAMRSAGMRCIVLSLGRGRQNGSGIRHPATARRLEQGTVMYAAFWHLPLLTHVASFFSLAFLLGSLIRRYPGVRVLAYNRSYHYLPALCLARLLGVRVYLDLEDGYIVENGGWLRHFKNDLTRRLFNDLCSSGAMVATSSLCGQLRHSAPLVCYGVAGPTAQSMRDWQAPKLRLLFGGTLLEEAGSRLLLDALTLLHERDQISLRALHLVVTGKGPWANVFRTFSARHPELLTFGEALPKTEYLDHLRVSHIGLSLRLAAFEMGGTTFPSKVVEYANHGLLVLTTRASDVPALLGETACYLDNETPAALAELLAGLPARRAELARMASTGRGRVQAVCSPQAVGQALKQLLSSGMHG